MENGLRASLQKRRHSERSVPVPTDVILRSPVSSGDEESVVCCVEKKQIPRRLKSASLGMTAFHFGASTNHDHAVVLCAAKSARPAGMLRPLRVIRIEACSMAWHAHSAVILNASDEDV